MLFDVISLTASVVSLQRYQFFCQPYNFPAYLLLPYYDYSDPLVHFLSFVSVSLAAPSRLSDFINLSQSDWRNRERNRSEVS